MIKKKTVDEVSCCFECEHLYKYGEVMRCSLYDNAIIEDTTEKQCKESIK